MQQEIIYFFLIYIVIIYFFHKRFNDLGNQIQNLKYSKQSINDTRLKFEFPFIMLTIDTAKSGLSLFAPIGHGSVHMGPQKLSYQTK